MMPRNESGLRPRSNWPQALIGFNRQLVMMPVGAMMAMHRPAMMAMMTAHLGVGVQHALLEGDRLGRRGMARAGGAGHRGCNKHGSHEQRGGNRLKHGRLLGALIAEVAGRMDGLFDQAGSMGSSR
jgi:hypothetical protein